MSQTPTPLLLDTATATWRHNHEYCWLANNCCSFSSTKVWISQPDLGWSFEVVGKKGTTLSEIVNYQYTNSKIFQTIIHHALAIICHIGHEPRSAMTNHNSPIRNGWSLRTNDHGWWVPSPSPSPVPRWELGPGSLTVANFGIQASNLKSFTTC